MLNNRFGVTFSFVAVTLFFCIARCFIHFDGEVVYTVDFILILSVAFHIVAKLDRFEPLYLFLANNWERYAMDRASALKAIEVVKGASNSAIALLITKQVACTETAKLGNRVLDPTTKANLIGVLV